MKSSVNVILAGVLILLGHAGNAQMTSVSSYFPEIKILASNGPAPGYYFLAAKGVSAPDGKLYIAIVDNYGTPVFFRLMPKASVSMRLLNDGTIGYAHGVPRKLYLLDEMLNVTDTINTVGEKLDGHDWDIDDKGDYHRFVFAQYTRTFDMSQVLEGGNAAAEIRETMVQEFDVENQLLNSWKTEDLFEVLDGNEASPYVDFTEQSIDYAHVNGIEIYSDTSFLLSSRHLEEITCIDRRNGEIIWRLGGKHNDFTFLDDPYGFSHQHCPRKLENGNLLVFDNGNLHNPEFSSAVEYELDFVQMTARAVRRYRRVPDAFAPRDGSAQRLENGNTVVTWGPVWPSMTEFHPDGTVALEIDMTEHSLSPRIEKYLWKTKVFETSQDSVDFGMYNGSDPVEIPIHLINRTDSVMHITGVTGRTDHFSVVSPLPLAMSPGIETEMILRFEPQNTYTGYLRDVLTISSDNETQRIARQLFVEGYQFDDTAPDLVIMPDSLSVPVDARVTLQFSEPVRRGDGSELGYGNILESVGLFHGAPDGEPVPLRATVSTDRMLITLYPDSLLHHGDTYHVVMKELLEDYSGNMVETSNGSFTTSSGTTVEIHTGLENLRIYPNPSSGIFLVRLNEYRNLGVQVFSSTGTPVWSDGHFDPAGEWIDLTGQPAGIYYLIFKSDSSMATGVAKLVKFK